MMVKHTDLDDDIVSGNWRSAEAWLNRKAQEIEELLAFPQPDESFSDWRRRTAREILAKVQDVCLDCKGHRRQGYYEDGDGELHIKTCPTCKGTAKEIARVLASMDNWRYDDLRATDISFTDGVTQSHYLRRAKAVLSLFNEEKQEGRESANLKQQELSEWQLKNFGQSIVEDMLLGMAEELGELCHWILKRKQGIREAATGGDFKDEIGDAFADVVIFGIQAMTGEGIDAQATLKKTIEEVLARDFVNNPSGKGYSQHKANLT